MKDRTTKRLEEAYRLVLENNINPSRANRFPSLMDPSGVYWRPRETPEQLAAQNREYIAKRNAMYKTSEDVINAYNASERSAKEAIDILMSQGIDQQKATEMIQTSRRGKHEYNYGLSRDLNH